MTTGFVDSSTMLPEGALPRVPPGGGPAAGRRRAATQDWMLFQPRVALQGGRLQAVEAATRMPPAQAGRAAGGAAGAGLDSAPGGRAARLAAWRLDAAACEIATWGDSAVRLCVAVPAELHPEALMSLLEDLDAEGDWERLELACTEAWLWALDGDGVMALSAIRDLGVELAVEDFGESGASLSLLRRLPLGVLRLHASLVRDLERGAEDRAMLRSIAGVAHAVGLRVAATGVDTLRQGDLLSGLGCDEGVGHALGPAVPLGQLAGWIGGGRGGGGAAGTLSAPARRERAGGARDAGGRHAARLAAT